VQTQSEARPHAQKYSSGHGKERPGAVRSQLSHLVEQKKTLPPEKKEPRLPLRGLVFVLGRP
jgi:hypothetical protein